MTRRPDRRYTVMTAIPYVNGRPHVGHALELVQADVLARHRRQCGDEVRFQTGTDDNALKNVQSAQAAGVAIAEYVTRVAERFADLGAALDLSLDDFIKTSSDPRHRSGVEKLWAACAARGDLYRKAYSGLYCVGCERFYARDELTADGRCDEHGTLPEVVDEDNWFFRLSGYQEQLVDLISTDRLRIEPASRKREVLSFVQAGLEDFSVSRSVARARGWGIPVPGDPDQVIYVWFDALANYITAPGYGTDFAQFDHWWNQSERVHVIGKGIIRFHAVYWPAMLLSAGISLPDTVFVHEYLTGDGGKISKSAGTALNPADIVAQYGSDALRWWLLSEVARSGDTDFTVTRMVSRANEDLANNLGNLVNRTVSMIHRYRRGTVALSAPTGPDAAAFDAAAFDPTAFDATARQAAAPETVALRRTRATAGSTIRTALADFDFRRAVDAITAIGDEGNRYVESVRPWELAKAERGEGASTERLDAVLAELIATCRDVAYHLSPFIPEAADRISRQCGRGSEQLPEPQPVFPRLQALID
jgi:methionyl-tRNA synthetase